MIFLIAYNGYSDILEACDIIPSSTGNTPNITSNGNFGNYFVTSLSFFKMLSENDLYLETFTTCNTVLVS